MARLRWFFLAGFLLMAAIGCSQPNAYQPPPLPTVTVARPVRKTVTNYLEETGTTEAVERVEIRARVKGFLNEVKFQPGTMVEQGASLYQIEPQLYQAKVDAAAAEVEAQQARLEKAKIERDRQERLKAEDPGATSEVALVSARAEYNGAEAGLKAARAALDEANIDLQYTNVTTPISGRVGKTLVKQGNLVGDGEATHLTTVIQYDPIYANFNISERDLLQLREKTPEKEDADRAQVPLYLRRANDEGFPFEGRFDYADLTVDQSMGTFMIRGIFPNPEDGIFPGLFVRIRVPIGQQEDALLVPERAVGADQAGKYLLVVNDQNEVQRRDVTVGSKLADMVVINQGLEPDDQVIVDGLQRARAGSKVTPKPAQLSAPGEQLETVRQGGGAMPEETAEEPETGGAAPAADEPDRAPDQPPSDAADDEPKS